ncbi:hypothetical protein [Roseibium sp. SCP14]|uniref:hypothetical protein n=1 Tax=Roseibium sp. SCP14 TaxID=3141375 RepID=UPI00333CBB53
MANREDRKTLELLTAIAKVVEVPVPASASALTSMSRPEAVRIIEDRYSNFKLRNENAALTSSELESALSGNTIYGAPYSNDPYVLAFHPGGEGHMKVRGREPEVGTWWINSDDTIHSKWEEAASGKDIAIRYYRTANPFIFLHEAASRELPPVECRMCIVQPGLAL